MSELIGVQPFIAYPINRQNSYGFKQNSPLIEFSFASQSQRLLDASSLTLNAKIRVLQGSSSTQPSATQTRPNNDKTNAGKDQYECRMDDRISVNSIIDVLRIRNLKSETLEEIRSYGRYMSSVLAGQHSYAEYKNQLSNKFQAPANEKTMGLMVNQDVEFSIPLNAGILQSSSALNMADLGGLVFSIMLQSDAQVLYGSGATDGAFYQLTDVSLTGNYFVYSAPVPPTQNVLEFPAYNSFMSIVNSGDDSISLNLSQRSIRSIVLNSIPSSHLNNYSFNGFVTQTLRNTNDAGDTYNSEAKVKEYTFMRGAVKFPKGYSTSQRQQVDQGAAAFIEPVKKQRDYLDSIKGYWALQKSLCSTYTETNITNDTGDIDVPTRALAEDRPITGLGLRLDNLSNGIGASYMDSVFSLRLQSELDGKSPNSVFLYTLSNQAIKNNRAGEIQAIQ